MWFSYSARRSASQAALLAEVELSLGGLKSLSCESDLAALLTNFHY